MEVLLSVCALPARIIAVQGVEICGAMQNEKWQSDVLDQTGRWISETSEGCEQAQNERRGEMSCAGPMPQAKAPPNLCLTSWHSIRPGMGWSRASP